MVGRYVSENMITKEGRRGELKDRRNDEKQILSKRNIYIYKASRCRLEPNAFAPSNKQ